MHNAQSDNQKYTLYDQILFFFCKPSCINSSDVSYFKQLDSNTKPCHNKSSGCIEKPFSLHNLSRVQQQFGPREMLLRHLVPPPCIYIHIHLVHRSLFSKVQQSRAAKLVTVAKQSAFTAPDPFFHFTFECAMRHWSTIEEGHANRLKAFFLFRAVTWHSYIFGAD